jgi:hypothetical protein
LQSAIPLGGECLKSCLDDPPWEDQDTAMNRDISMKRDDNYPNKDNHIEGASATLAADGILIVVGYHTCLPISSVGKSGQTFILDQRSGKRLGVQNVPLIGALASHSRHHGKLSDGYFVVDNAEKIVGPGSLVTVVVGDLRMENVAVNS